MIGTWFSAQIRYDKTMENGLSKKVKNVVMVDAMSFTEAECRTIEEMKPYISGDFNVISLKKEMIQEVFVSDREQDDTWFKIRVAFVTLDEKNHKEKKTYHNMLVLSCSTAEAEKHLHECMKGTMTDYVVKSITETDIFDVFFFHREGVTDENR